MNKTYRFECNNSAVAVIGIVALSFVAINVTARIEQRKKEVELHKIEAELRKRNADASVSL